jgi:hypothetical protein
MTAESIYHSTALLGYPVPPCQKQTIDPLSSIRETYMKRAGWFTCPAVTLAMVGFAVPQVKAADMPRQSRPVDPQPAPAAPTAAPVADVALADGGVLRGQVVDPQGAPLPYQTVAVRQQQRVIASTRTDQDGRFSISGLPGGVYQIASAEGAGVYRLWAPLTAPPAAQPAALIVSGQQVFRGQLGGGGGVRSFLTSPWVLAGLLAAAISIPIALSNREKISTS